MIKQLIADVKKEREEIISNKEFYKSSKCDTKHKIYKVSEYEGLEIISDWFIGRLENILNEEIAKDLPGPAAT